MSGYISPNQHNDAGGGFKLFRKQSNLEFLDALCQEFAAEFDGHSLYPHRTSVLDVVKRRETKPVFIKSRALIWTPLGETIIKVLGVSPPHANRRVDLAPTRLEFSRERNSSHRINLLLDDPEGLIEEEREAYFTALERLSNVQIKDQLYRPSVELGRSAKGVEPSVDALRMLASFIPDYVHLQRVVPFPDPSYIRI